MNNLQVKKTYNFNGVDYNSKEEAVMAASKHLLETEISKGVQNVIDKAPDIIRAIRIITSN